ncbi:MAG: rhomboid family intramembrane serine protease [Bacteroidales bacterium]|nr:rhomboid family intramembrane serine protease [Bacteroidales bacterium]
MNKTERIKIIYSLLYPTLFVLMIWLVKSTELVFNLHLSNFGIMPLKIEGLAGIITAPFVHGDMAHLSANTLPIWVLGTLLFYVYRKIAWKVLILIWLATGLWVWVLGREAYHIGASGVIYGLASFLFFSGIFRRDGRLLSITFLVAFLYGSMIWGVFPDLFPEKNISWESHLMGLLAGLVLAVFFRNEGGPIKKKYSWDIEEDDGIDEKDPDAYWNKPIEKKKKAEKKTPEQINVSEPVTINYVFKKKEDKSDN